ncbi:MAG: hypothetical protein LBD79_07960 [Treponema sp.]|jgi:hypothetical protein|nr:hypothetical protein [Treponema sp.]
MRPPLLIKGFAFFRKIPAKAVGGLSRHDISRLFAGAACSLPTLLSGVPYSSWFILANLGNYSNAFIKFVVYNLVPTRCGECGLTSETSVAMDAQVEGWGLDLAAVSSHEFAGSGNAWMYFAITCAACRR